MINVNELDIDVLNPWYTHTPITVSAMNTLVKSEKMLNILELGMGNGSSKIFSTFAEKYSNVHITSIETDTSWFNTCSEQYYKGLKNVNLLNHSSYDEKYLLDFQDIDLMFVDQGSWDDRSKSLMLLHNKCRKVIVHDYDYIVNHYNPTHACLKNYFTNFVWHDEPKTESTLEAWIDYV